MKVDRSIKSINVLDVIYRHLNNSLLYTESLSPLAGIYIHPKPKTARVDVIELGLLAHVRLYDSITGVVNINYYEENLERIEEVVPLIINIIDLAFCENFTFEVEPDYDHLFRVSHKLSCHNIRTRFNLPNKYYDFN